jgi:hypothetical protein
VTARTKTLALAGALAVAGALLTAAPAQATVAPTCWVTASAPRITYGITGTYVSGRGENSCSPPSTVASVRVEVQKRKSQFLWPDTWVRVGGGSTIYARPGQLDLASSASGRCEYGKTATYRVLVFGTALNATVPRGAASGANLKLACR